MTVRFRALLPHMVAVGDRVVVAPEHVIEEWGRGVGGGRTGSIPRRVTAVEPRRGTVVRVTRETPEGVEAMLDDQPPIVVPVGAVLTVVGPVQLCTPADLRRLVEHLAFREVPNAIEAASVAVQCGPWLIEKFRHVVPDQWPDYDHPDLWAAWLTGLSSQVPTLTVPPFPGRVERALRPPIPSAPIRVAPDAVDMLRRTGRAN